MKQTFTLLLAFLISISMYAYPATSKLSISSTSKASLRIMVDGNRYKTNNNNNSVLLNSLQPGYHVVKIYQAARNFKPAPGNVNGNGGHKLVYSANVYVKPQYHVDIVVNRFGKVFKDEQPVAFSYDNDDDEDWGDNNWNDNGWNNQYDNNNDREMNAQSFNSFKQTLQNENFDNTRMNIARQVIGTNNFTTAQIREVLGYFSFENNKLEMAKYAYKNTLDKNNYFSLTDVFSFSSNKDELMTYIQNYR